METTKKTGLGSSLLLQRTETAEPPQHGDVPDVQTSETAKRLEVSNVPMPRPSRRPATSRKGKAKRLVLRDKCTLFLDREVNERLDLAARVEGMERSEMATEILRKYLPNYRITKDE